MALHTTFDKPLMAGGSAARAGSVRFRLREETSASHAAVDSLFARFNLGRTADYRDFLQIQYACLAPLETALDVAGAQALLPDWPARRRADLLAADLADLDTTPAPAAINPSLAGPAAIFGAIYVLEGSRFGGGVLARRLAPGAPARFLGAGADPAAWRALVSALDRQLVIEADIQTAVASARAVFAAFEAAGRTEPALG